MSPKLSAAGNVDGKGAVLQLRNFCPRS